MLEEQGHGRDREREPSGQRAIARPRRTPPPSRASRGWQPLHEDHQRQHREQSSGQRQGEADQVLPRERPVALHAVDAVRPRSTWPIADVPATSAASPRRPVPSLRTRARSRCPAGAPGQDLAGSARSEIPDHVPHDRGEVLLPERRGRPTTAISAGSSVSVNWKASAREWLKPSAARKRTIESKSRRRRPVRLSVCSASSPSSSPRVGGTCPRSSRARGVDDTEQEGREQRSDNRRDDRAHAAEPVGEDEHRVGPYPLRSREPRVSRPLRGQGARMDRRVARAEDLPPPGARVIRTLQLEPSSRDLPTLAAASGVVRRGEYVYVVGDDLLFLAVFDASSKDPGRLNASSRATSPIPPTNGRRPSRTSRCSPCCRRSSHPHGALLGLGSGSTPERDRGFAWGLAADGSLDGEPLQLDLAPLYSLLRENMKALNVEGAAVMGDELWLLQRGNSEQGANLVVSLELSEVLDSCCGIGRSPRPSCTACSPSISGSSRARR